MLQTKNTISLHHSCWWIDYFITNFVYDGRRPMNTLGEFDWWPKHWKSYKSIVTKLFLNGYDAYMMHIYKFCHHFENIKPNSVHRKYFSVASYPIFHEYSATSPHVKFGNFVCEPNKVLGEWQHPSAHRSQNEQPITGPHITNWNNFASVYHLAHCVLIWGKWA